MSSNQIERPTRSNVSRITNDASLIDFDNDNLDISEFDPLSRVNQVDLNSTTATAVGGTGRTQSVKPRKKAIKLRSGKLARVNRNKNTNVMYSELDYAEIAKQITKLLVSGEVFQIPSKEDFMN